MTTENMKHEISYHLEENRFILYLEITNHSGGERRFYFSNDTGRLARNGIKLFDAEDKAIKACEIAFVSPAYDTEYVENILPPDEKQRFELPARIIEEETDLILSFKGISFRVPRNEKFYITFDFLKIPSNKLEVIIEMANDKKILERKEYEYDVLELDGNIILSVPTIYSKQAFDVIYRLNESEKENYLRRGITTLKERMGDMRTNAVKYEMKPWK